MTVIQVSWYLCVLFGVALIVSSAISVAPDGQAWMRLEMGTLLTLSAAFAASAILFKRFRIREPKWMLRLLQAFALLATFVILMMVGG